MEEITQVAVVIEEVLSIYKNTLIELDFELDKIATEKSAIRKKILNSSFEEKKELLAQYGKLNIKEQEVNHLYKVEYLLYLHLGEYT